MSRGAIQLRIEGPTSYVMLRSPQVEISGVENGEEGDTPGDSVNDYFRAPGSELIDGHATEKAVDQSPACTISSSLCLKR